MEWVKDIQGKPFSGRCQRYNRVSGNTSGLPRSRLRNGALSPPHMLHRPKQVITPRIKASRREKYTLHSPFFGKGWKCAMQKKKKKKGESEKEKEKKR